MEGAGAVLFPAQFCSKKAGKRAFRLVKSASKCSVKCPDHGGASGLVVAAQLLQKNRFQVGVPSTKLMKNARQRKNINNSGSKRGRNVELSGKLSEMTYPKITHLCQILQEFSRGLK